MKRFTETSKWEKEWFQDSSPKMKLLWLYLMDKSDACGVWDINLRLASFQLGEKITEDDLKAFGERLELLKENKLWIKSFCKFQYGELSEKSPPHKNVINLLTKHKLIDRVEVPLAYPSDGVQDKEKEKDKEKVNEIIEYLNKVTGHQYTNTPAHSKMILGRLKGKGVTVAGIKEMIDSKYTEWGKDEKMSAYLRPGTLFRESNFPNYYGARKKLKKPASQPVDATGRKIKKFK